MATYSAVNKRTLKDIIDADTANSQEVAWMASVIMQSRLYNPISGWFGGLGGGKPIIEVADFRRLAGQEIVAKRKAGFGARGRQGDSARVGYEEKVKDRYFRAKVGAMWHGSSQSRIASAQTAMGSEWDKDVQSLLSEWAAARQHMDVEAEIFRAARLEATTDGAALTSGRNIVRPNAVGSEDALGSADVFSLSTITDVRDSLLALNAKALMISNGPNKQRIPRYYIQGTQFLFADLNRNSTFKELVAMAENRGPSQSLLAGGKPIIDNTILNEWMIEANDYDATQGARLIPFATTGVAIPADPTAALAATNNGSATIPINALGFVLTFGGSAAAALKTDVDYVQNFHNAPYVGFEGEKFTTLVEATSPERYIAVRARSGSNAGLWRHFAYTLCDGNKMVLTRALSASGGTGASASTAASINRSSLANISTKSYAAQWGVGGLADTTKLTEAEIAIGAEVYQCNARGTILSYGYGISDGFMMCGYGSLDGKTAFGRRTEEKQEHGKDIAIGMEMVWGCKANEDTNGTKNGFVVVQGAYTPQGYFDAIV